MLLKCWSQRWIDDGLSRKTQFKIILLGEKVYWPKKDWHPQLMAVRTKVHQAAGKVEALDPELLRERVLFALDPIGSRIGPRERKGIANQVR